MKKTITFGIPCYNSAAYMDKCVESILVGFPYPLLSNTYLPIILKISILCRIL